MLHLVTLVAILNGISALKKDKRMAEIEERRKKHRNMASKNDIKEKETLSSTHTDIM